MLLLPSSSKLKHSWAIAPTLVLLLTLTGASIAMMLVASASNDTLLASPDDLSEWLLGMKKKQASPAKHSSMSLAMNIPTEPKVVLDDKVDLSNFTLCIEASGYAF